MDIIWFIAKGFLEIGLCSRGIFNIKDALFLRYPVNNTAFHYRLKLINGTKRCMEFNPTGVHHTHNLRVRSTSQGLDKKAVNSKEVITGCSKSNGTAISLSVTARQLFHKSLFKKA